ncbi:hypothetical protein KCU91_g12610, partial [Aureobasidium melanogenum]
MDPQSNNPSTEDASAKMQDIDNKKQDSTNASGPTDPADPTFFSLSLDERHNIYHQQLDPKGKKTLVVEPPNSINTINKLLKISPQVRTEVVALIATETTALVQAGLYYNLKLEPHTVAIPDKPKKKSKKSKKQNTTTAQFPDDLKVWKMVIVVFTAEKSIRVKAQMDFKENSVVVDLPGFPAEIFSSNYCDYVFGDFEDAFAKAMKAFTDKDGFDGFVLKDVAELLHKVEMPCPKHFWDEEELFGMEYSDEWDEDDECKEEYYSGKNGEDDEDGEDGDVEAGVAENKDKVNDGEEVKVKAEAVKVGEKIKSEATDAGA